jgi:hypothetical protein
MVLCRFFAHFAFLHGPIGLSGTNAMNFNVCKWNAGREIKERIENSWREWFCKLRMICLGIEKKYHEDRAFLNACGANVFICM